VWISTLCGERQFPNAGPVIVAANHASYLDFLCLGAVAPRSIYFLTGEVFFRKWWLHPLFKWTGQVCVKRDDARSRKEAFNDLAQLLQAGKAVGIFPEGRRSRSGTLQHFFPGVARLSVDCGVPILPTAIIGSYQAWPPHRPYPLLKKTISIYYGSTIYPEDYSNETEVLQAVQNSIEALMRQHSDATELENIS